MNPARSVLRGPQPECLSITIVHREPRLDQEMIVRQAGGAEQRLVFSYMTTGEETTNDFGGRPARSRLHWDGTELVIESWIESAGRELRFEDHWSLSVDGQTLTMAHHNDPLDGQIALLGKVP